MATEEDYELIMNLRGPRGVTGRVGPQGLPASETLPTDAAVAAYVAGASVTSTALSKLYQRVITPEAYGAVGDGIADDFTALSQALSDIEPGVAVVLSGIYRTTQPLPVADKTDFEIRGKGEIRLDCATASTSGSVVALPLSNCSRFTLEGFTLTVVNQAQQQGGIRLLDCADVTIAKCIIFGARWCGISTGSTCARVNITDNTIRQCRFGIAASGKGITIRGNYITSDWFSLPEAVSPWTPASKHWDGIILGNDSTGTLASNFLIECGQSGVWAEAVRAWTISNNVIERCQNKGIDIGPEAGTAVNVVVTGNACKDNASEDLHFFNVTHSIISGNTAMTSDVLYYGAKLSKPGIAINGACFDVAITGNMVRLATGNVTSPGIFVNNVAPASGRVTIAGNVVDAITQYSVSTVAGTGNTVI